MARSGAKLRTTRVALGFDSATAAAFAAGITEGYLIRLETGAVPITDSVLVKLARGWKKSVDWLERKVAEEAAA